MSQPHISRLSIWEKHKSRVIEVLLAALAILQNKLVHGRLNSSVVE